MDNRQQKAEGCMLVVDDDLRFRQTLEAILTGEGYDVRCAASGETALMFAAEDPPELILLDVRLPDMDGFEVCRRLREDPRTGRIPVIFISGLDEVADKVKGFEFGGVDYIAKPFQHEEVLARVRLHLDLMRTKEALRRTNEGLEKRIAKRTVDLNERLQFERLVSNLSSRFVNIPPDRVDPEMEDGLREILEFFRVDRIGLLRSLPDRSAYQITHLVSSENVPSVPVGVELPGSTFPWVHEKLTKNHEVMAFSRLDDLPPEANVDKQKYAEWGVRSALDIPIITGGSAVHVIAINSTKGERGWPEELFPRLQLLGEIFVNAIERKQVRLEIQERLRLESLISNLSAIFLNLPADRVDIEINKGLRSITEFFDADRCTIELFSEDRTRLTRAYEYHAAEAEPGPESGSKEQMPWYFEQLLRGNPVMMNRIEDLPPEAEEERRLCRVKNMKSLLFIPLISGGRTLGSCALVSARAERIWPEAWVRRFRLLTEVFANVLDRKRREDELQERLQEIERLKQQLEKENIQLREEIKLQYVHEEIVGRSEIMKKVLAQVEQVARMDSTVLIQGETGTGKELVARAIHQLSRRKDRPLVSVNCASLPPTLIESELFGREKGAYTGALTRMVGRFEMADGATLFLDEIGELPQEVQSKLLRVLEEGRFERLGASRTLQVNVRIIAATNRDLAKDVNEGKFRKDLYYRVNVFPIAIPPLRERPEDISFLVWAFVRQFEKKMGKRVDSISRKSLEALRHHSWPGNVRELRNVIEHSMIVSSGRTLTITLPKMELPGALEPRTLKDMERRHILDVLEKTGWRIDGEGGASKILGMKRTTLQSKMKKLGIKRPAA